jgi:hypothetical protein
MESMPSPVPKSPVGIAPVRRNRHARSRVTNGSDVLPGVDGRTMIARRFYDVLQSLIADQAGLDRCSEAKLQLIRRFAASAVMAEELEAKLARGEQIDITQHAALSSTLVRLAQRIGIERRARNVTPSLNQYLAGKTAPANGDADSTDAEGTE